MYCWLNLCGNMAEWSKAPESGSLVGYLVRKGEGSNPSVVIMALLESFGAKVNQTAGLSEPCVLPIRTILSKK